MGSKSSSLTVVVFCQACGTKLMFAPAVVGKKARCLTCGHIFTVPAIKGQKTPPPPPPQSTPQPPSSSAEAHEHTSATCDSTSPVDPLAELAASERSAAGEDIEPLQKFVNQEDEVQNVIGGPASDVQATATAVSVMQGLFYTAVIATVVFLLVHFMGPILAAWIALPILVVYGKKITIRTAFLITGGAIGAPKTRNVSQ